MKIFTEIRHCHNVKYFLHKTIVDVLFVCLSQFEETITIMVKTKVDVLQFQKIKKFA